MILVDLVSMILRLAELAFGGIVLGITAHYLHALRHSDSWSQGRFIYTEVVAGISVFFALIWLFPFSGSFIHWPVDLILSVCWFVAFGLIVDSLNGSCGGVFDWNGIGFGGANSCSEWKADVAFAFLCAICWLASTLLGLYWIHRHERPVVHTHTRRRYWYRSRV